MTDPRPYSLIAKYYDSRADLASKRALARQLHTYVGSQRAREGFILDLACGTGNISQALLDLGYRVHSIDRSPEMLAIALSKLGGGRFTADLQDMRGLHLPTARYCGAVCGSFSLGYLTEEKHFQSAIRQVCDSLVSHGTFLFDMAGPEFFTGERLADQRKAWARSGVVMNFNWRGEKEYEYTYSTLREDGRLSLERHRGRCWTPDDVKRNVTNSVSSSLLRILNSELPEDLARTGLDYYVLCVS
ncbi:MULTISPECIES: class I SAM-dependent methyltransferase [unclassified Streptomyces]|uniref:class I SAM-dependent DNA methyltransferase n=1 Tax=unclassified Streptomyces TaxID=2593676 RepID=UPI00163D40E6|nr:MULTISPECIES: class I SAM-dependent methyltransferase [unclassified Streptomyces]